MDGSGQRSESPVWSKLEPIAIVGAACRMPGAPDLAAFERLLFDGRDAVSEVPESRWAKQRYLHPDRGQAGKTYTFAAGLLERVDEFDAAFFGISPREAAQMDPQQRLMLELAHEAMEDAGLDGAAVGGTEVGVYVGGSSWDYLTLHTGDPSIMDAYSMTGATLCSLANRVSYAFDLRGPSLTVDTACSSSLVALHQACEAIRAGQIPMALVGGVSLLLAPHSFVGFSAASMLSPRGRCHAFDARADGYVRSEGGGVIVLRPLRDALAAGDSIRALIRGTGVNSDGRTTGFSLPNKVAQRDLLQAVYGRFGVDPNELCYVEAHGTGTPAGDPIEAAALGEALGQERSAPLPIGSVKTNIGHLEAASGVAGLLKAVMVLKRGVVPASLHCETPNPAIPFGALGLQLVPEPLAVPKGHLVGVNSFGFGGTNAHAVLEAMDGIAWPAAADTAQDMPLLLSARSKPALRDLAAAWRDRLAAGDVDAAVIRAAALARESHKNRLVACGGSAARNAAALADWLDDRGSYDVVAGEAVAGKVGFVFSGNGSQWAGMAGEAVRHNAPFRLALAEVDAVLRPVLGWSVVDRLGDPEWPVADTTVAQPLLFAVQVATVKALGQAGIHADVFLGHSVGEVAAAWAAGALRLDQACQVIAVRSRLQALTAGRGRMGVVGLPLDQLAPVLAEAGLEVAAVNASAAVTVAGPAEEVAAFAARAEQQRWPFAAMELDHAFHSAAMDVIEGPLLDALAPLAPPLCPAAFLSTVTGGALAAGSRLDAAYWWRNVRAPVRFAEAAAAAVAAGVRILVEIGPQPVLQSYLDDAFSVANVSGRTVATLTRRTPKGRDPLPAIAARCHAAGCDMRGAAVFAGPRRHRDLPAYPWQRQRHWLGRTSDSMDIATVPHEHPLLGTRRDPGEALEWTSQLGPGLQPWLADHVVGGATVAPAAVLIEMALAAAKARHPAARAWQVLDFEISRPLTFEPGVLREVRLRVIAATADFQIASRPRLSDEFWTVHAIGRIAADETNQPVRPLPPALAGAATTTGPELYALAVAMGLSYGPAFQVVTGVATAGATRADISLGGVGDTPFLLPPTVLDGAFQGLLALAARVLPAGYGVVPWRFGRVRWLSAAPPATARVSVARVGPRSVRADIHLVDAAGAAVAELVDCWFVQVALGLGQGVDGWTYHVAQVASADPAGETQAGTLLPLVLRQAPAAAPDETGLLADAFAAAAVAETVRGLLAAPDATFTVAALAVPERQETCAEMLGWLAADGLATVEDGRWQLTEGELASGDDILRTLVFDSPTAVADAALLAAAAEGLAARWRGGPAPTQAAALADHWLHASPAGSALGRALLDRIAGVARALPGTQPLRVLQLGAQRGLFSHALLRALAADGRTVQLLAVTSPADQPALADALAAHPAAAAVAALPAEVGPFDVVVGFCALAIGGTALEPTNLGAVLPLAPGGLVLLAEPGPNRLWSLVWPEAAGSLRDGQAWVHALSESGMRDAAWVPVEAGWAAGLLVGRPPAAAPLRPIETGRITLFAEPGDALADALELRLQAAGPVLRCSVAAPWPAAPGRVVLLPADGPVAPWLARLARGTASGAEITLVTPAGPSAAALGGLRRVMANEAPDVVCRQIVLDGLDADTAAARVAAELAQAGAEGEVTWSPRGRTVPRLRPGLPAPGAVAPDRPLLLSVARPGLLDTIGWDAMPTMPTPGPGQVALRVRAAGLNFRDVMWGMGLLPDEALLDGFAGPTFGLECAGEVVAVGDGVDAFRPGDRVMAFAPASLATYAVTAAHAVMAIPPGMDFAAAATIPVAFLTVAYSLGHLTRIEPGERLLVHGGAGGVGLAAIQFAKLRGATVFATAGTEAKRALLRRLGVDAVFDSRGLAFADEVMRLTGGEGVDVVLNSLSGAAMEASLGLLRPFGRFLELGKRDFYGNTRVGLRPFRHNISYHGVDVDQLPLRQPKLAARLLADIAGLMADGSLRPLPYRQFDAADAAEAFRLMQGSGHIGKIVLGFDGPLTARKPASGPAPVRPDRSYLVTGGLDGFGLEAALWLARQGARHIALLSRRGGETPGTALRQLRAAGADAVAYACDVGDEAALAATLAKVRASLPPIGGVIHAAVAMDDGLLPAMDEARFARALHPKLGGAALLDRLTRPDPVDLFVVFSSVTSVLGNPGQANYVAANAAAEAVVEQRHREGLPGLAVQWGPIGDTGYLMREAAVGRLLSKRLGGRLLGAAEALAALPALLASGQPVLGLANVRWSQLGAGLPLLRTPMFQAIHGSLAEPASEVDLAELLASCTPEAAQAKLTELLAEEVARIMRMPAGSILPHRPLAELGMDSLMAVELRLAVEQRFGLTVPVMALSDGATLAALARRMARSASGAAPDQGDEVQKMAERMSRYETVPDAATLP